MWAMRVLVVSLGIVIWAIHFVCLLQGCDQSIAKPQKTFPRSVCSIVSHQHVKVWELQYSNQI